jgi:ABC-type ATPase involved in cell division
MITCSCLRKVYGTDPGRCALDGVDFHMDKGEFVTLRGPVGAGKTTLLRLICGLTAPTSGELTVYGLKLPAPGAQLAALRRKMGIIEQEPRLLEEASVYDNVALGLEVLGFRGAQLSQKTLRALRALGLEALAQASPRSLSAGQRQKVSVARALAGEPLIVLADEPCRHLDAEGASEVLALLRWLNLQGSTVLAMTGECWPLDVPARCLRLEAGRLLGEPRGAACAC